MGAIEAIPEDVVWADWPRTIVGEPKYITETFSDRWAAAAAVRARKHSEYVKETVSEAGELALLMEPFCPRRMGRTL